MCGPRLCTLHKGRCLSISETYVVIVFIKDVEEKIIPIIKKLLVEFYGETPELSPDYCRIVSSRHFSRLSSMLSATQGNIVVGGASSEETRFMELAVLSGVGWDDATMQVIITQIYKAQCYQIITRKRYLSRYFPL